MHTFTFRTASYDQSVKTFETLVDLLRENPDFRKGNITVQVKLNPDRVLIQMARSTETTIDLDFDVVNGGCNIGVDSAPSESITNNNNEDKCKNLHE